MVEIDAEIERLDCRIESLESHKSRLQSEKAALLSTFKVGDKVSWERGANRLTGLVKSIHLSWFSENAFVKCAVIRKDGTEGRLCDVYDYKNPVKI